MAQIFDRSANSIARLTLAGMIAFIVFLGWACIQMERSPWNTREGQVRAQPIPFSHAHHVGGLGIDCRYCHTTVEQSSFAGIPPTKTCMNCHSQIWTGAPMLEPVRASFVSNESIPWTRVYDLPDYVYFQHDIHINKGIGCDVCHGRVDRMPLMYSAHSLQMEWCLDCHRAPYKYIRPRDQVFNVEYGRDDIIAACRRFGISPPNQISLGKKLETLYAVRSPRDITSCSTCHR
jgi:hypothetical protein